MKVTYGRDDPFHRKKEVMMLMRNEMTPASAYSLLHWLYHLRGRAFWEVRIGCRCHYRHEHEAAIINPSIFECFRDEPLDIRISYFALDDVPSESMKRQLKTTIKPEQLDLWNLDATSMNESELKAFFEFVAVGKKWCSTLELISINTTRGFIDALIKVCIRMSLYDDFCISFSTCATRRRSSICRS